MAIWYDLFLLLLIFSGMLLGFSMGLVRQVINIVALYIGLVTASFFQVRLMRMATNVMGQSDSLVRETVIFLVVFVIVWLIFNVAAFISFRTAPRFLPDTADRLVGMLLGVVTGLLLAAVVTLALSYATSVEWPQNNETRRAIQGLIEASTIRPFVGALIPALAQTIEPWLPAGLPSFFLTDL